ncbi:MAG: Flp family type IVb pilin [Sphingomonas sp.]|nr:Flp family type IVb pilin [Sphingomonas sp.]
MRVFIGIFKDESGATAVEYGLILALIFLAMVGAVSQFADGTITMWDSISNQVRNA